MQGGAIKINLGRYQTFSSQLGMDPTTGLISDERPEESSKSDYFSFCSIGPFLHLQSGEHIGVQVAMAIQACDYLKPANDPADPSKPNPGRYSAMIDNAIEAQKTFRGKYIAPPQGVPTPDLRGRETGLIAPPGADFEASDCRDEENGASRRSRATRTRGSTSTATSAPASKAACSSRGSPPRRRRTPICA